MSTIRWPWVLGVGAVLGVLVSLLFGAFARAQERAVWQAAKDSTGLVIEAAAQREVALYASLASLGAIARHADSIRQAEAARSAATSTNLAAARADLATAKQAVAAAGTLADSAGALVVALGAAERRGELAEDLASTRARELAAAGELLAVSRDSTRQVLDLYHGAQTQRDAYRRRAEVADSILAGPRVGPPRRFLGIPLPSFRMGLGVTAGATACLCGGQPRTGTGMAAGGTVALAW